VIANNGFFATDHPGRAFMALTVYFRHMGLIEEELSPRLRELATSRMLDHARILGMAMRVAYLISAATPDVLPNTPMQIRRRKLVLVLRGKYRRLAGDRVFNRLKQLGRLIGREPVIELE
jgi:exopolyphosphatase/guanosine-5'-triphosphate,3'-diphosphate pyrophosphatase